VNALQTKTRTQTSLLEGYEAYPIEKGLTPRAVTQYFRVVWDTVDADKKVRNRRERKA
jgi:hypothetical protein